MRWLRILVSAALLCTAVLSQVMAQQSGKVYRFGILEPGASPPTVQAVLAELGRQGFTEGQNLIVDTRVGTASQLPELARELVALRPDVVLALSDLAVHAIQNAAPDVPIVGWYSADPASLGFALSLSRPGGQITGLQVFSEDLDAKRLEILRETVPAARHFAFLGVSPERHRRRMTELGRLIGGAEWSAYYALNQDQYPAAFAAMRSDGAQALLILATREFALTGPTLAVLALEARLPTACEWAYMAEQGCLLGYGPSLADMRRRTGEYVALILKGASPSDLPIERPARLELAINLKTAQVLRIEIPADILARADKIIE